MQGITANQPMKKNFTCIIFLLSFFAFPACNRRDHKADLPDVQNIYGNITYLDSLLQSDEIDSITAAVDLLENTIKAYAGRAQSAEDKVILDSIGRISVACHEFLRFCIDSRANLELLNQDIVTAETQYKSGQLKSGNFISALIESEQIQVEINNRLFLDRAATLEALNNYALLAGRLKSLPQE